MSRADALGMFWCDNPIVKVKKEKEVCVPPERTWEEPDYLPHLDEALAFNVPQLTDEELIAESGNPFVFDIECYTNYFLIAFQSLITDKVIDFELNDGQWNDKKLRWIFEHMILIGFNSKRYDLPMAALALDGMVEDQLKQYSNALISMGESPFDLLRAAKVKAIKCDHIDLIEVAPLSASLKIYGGRLNVRRMQDLPFPHYVTLSPEQKAIVRWYCINDLDATKTLHNSLKAELQLREDMSTKYEIDLRSKSDAQIAEAILAKQLRTMGAGALYGPKIQRPYIMEGTAYRYRAPRFLRYSTGMMNHVLATVCNSLFVVNEYGKIGMPRAIKDLNIRIGNAEYTIGIGGLHSNEKQTAHYADENAILIDRDVASYYPAIILNSGLYPQHIGPSFLSVYKQIVDTRLHAKRSGNKVVADSLKITINGSFGKFGNRYSILYSPDLVTQVTVTGQLGLLMLIERLELQGIPVVSANTDGIVVKCPKLLKPTMDHIVKQWENETRFETEATEYKALYSKDVNNYIAVKYDGTAKCKGAYSEAGLHKNPTNQICTDAVLAHLCTGKPIESAIRNCTDISKFINVRKVKGGAVKDGEYLGTAIRWYYAEGVEGYIIYASRGSKVPRSKGAKPLMDLPDTFPSDIDYDWYIKEAYAILKSIGCEQTIFE